MKPRNDKKTQHKAHNRTKINIKTPSAFAGAWKCLKAGILWPRGGAAGIFSSALRAVGFNFNNITSKNKTTKKKRTLRSGFFSGFDFFFRGAFSLI